MSSYKIYGTKYPLCKTCSTIPDAYAINGTLVDIQPAGKKVGYVTMDDGSNIECYSKFNPLFVIVPTIVLFLVCAIVVGYLYFFQEKDSNIAGIPIKTGDDYNIVSYNGFMSKEDDSIIVNFQNGDYVSYITIKGEGIESETIRVEPNEYISKIPAKFSSSESVVQATIHIETDTSKIEEEVVVEIPENLETDSVPDDERDGYWKGEYIYGTSIEPTD